MSQFRNVALLVYADKHPLNIAGLVSDFHAILMVIYGTELILERDCENTVFVDLGSTRIALGWVDKLSKGYSGCIIVSIGPIPTSPARPAIDRYEEMCTQLVERLQHHFPPITILWRHSGELLTGNLADRFFEELPPLMQLFPFQEPIWLADAIGCQSPGRAVALRGSGAANEPIVKETSSIVRSSSASLIDLGQRLDEKHAPCVATGFAGTQSQGSEMMISGYVIISILLAGLAGLATKIVFGQSVLLASVIYVAVAITSTIFKPLFSYERDRRGHSEKRVDAEIATPVNGERLMETSRKQLDLVALSADLQMTIIAVDDDPIILELIQIIAANAGLRNVVTASSASTAIYELAKAGNSVGCVLLDINMPEMNGIDLCRKIRSLPGCKNICIIMLTANTDDEYLDKAFKAGATDYTTKPFDVIELSERLQAAQRVFAARRRVSFAGIANDGEAMDGREISGGQSSDITVPISTEELGDFIDISAFIAYLNRLSGRALVKTVVVAVHAYEIDTQYSETPASSFNLLMRQIAIAIDGTFGPGGYAASYVGSGKFVILCNREAVRSIVNLNVDLQLIFENSLLGQLELNPKSKLLIGAPVRLSTLRKDRAENAINAALDLAELRKSDMSSPTLAAQSLGRGTVTTNKYWA